MKHARFKAVDLVFEVTGECAGYGVQDIKIRLEGSDEQAQNVWDVFMGDSSEPSIQADAENVPTYKVEVVCKDCGKKGTMAVEDRTA